jgi:hypothetical protein
MGRRETGHKGGRTVRGNRDLRVVLRPGRMDALAVGGYKRSRGRESEREPYASVRSPAWPTFRTRALDLPFIDVKRGPRCTMGGVAMSHPVLEGKPNANHVRARISYSRTQRLHK